MTVIGHTMTRTSLTRELPTVTLLIGPPSIGKRALAEDILRHHGATPADVLRLETTADGVRQLHRHFATSPFGLFKAAILDITDAGPNALNALLKLLEEPPPRARIILLSENTPMLTVTSRANVHRMGYLTDDEVRVVLISKLSMKPEDAAKLARLSGGQVKKALEAADLATAKGPVLSLLKATADGDEDLFYTALNKWGNREQTMLSTWAVECVTGRWRAFTREESFGLAKDRRTAERVLRALRSGARPKIAAKLALADIMEANR